MLKSLVRAFTASRSAMAAVEFALILPVMLIILVGGVQLTDYEICLQKVDSLASTAADLVTQSPTLDHAGMANVTAALATVIYPYDSKPIKVVVTDLAVKRVFNSTATDGPLTVIWSKASGGAMARRRDSQVIVPDGLQSTDHDLVMVEIEYQYTPLLGNIGIGNVLGSNAMTLTSKFYARPRETQSVDGSQD